MTDWKKLLITSSALVSLGVVTNCTTTVWAASTQHVQQDEYSQAKKAGFTRHQVDEIKQLTRNHISFSTNKAIVEHSRATLSKQEQAIVNEAKQQIGVKFTWGGHSPQTGFDCSGLVSYVYQQSLNVSVGNTVNAQLDAGHVVSKSNLRPGDIVFFNNNSYNGIYIGDGNVIATIGTDKVGIVPLDKFGTFSAARRIISEDSNQHAVSKATELKDTYGTIISKNQTIWNGTDLSEKRSDTTKYYQQTVQLQRYYMIDGVKYYSAYDKDNHWIGYVNAKDVKLADDAGGMYISCGKDAKIIKKGYTCWRNLDFSAKKGTSDSIYGKTLKVKGYYNHFNGSTYASLYDNDDKWYGYLNTDALKYVSTTLKDYHSYGKYVTVTNKGYDIFKDKSLSSDIASSTKLYQNTYLAKGYYDNDEGDRYLTLYDSHDQWIGYINEKATKLGVYDGTSAAGAWIPVNKKGQVISRDYVLWNGFDFDKVRNTSSSINGKTIWVGGKYHMADGSWYYTIYDKQDGNWLGYINPKAIQM